MVTFFSSAKRTTALINICAFFFKKEHVHDIFLNKNLNKWFVNLRFIPWLFPFNVFLCQIWLWMIIWYKTFDSCRGTSWLMYDFLEFWYLAIDKFKVRCCFFNTLYFYSTFVTSFLMCKQRNTQSGFLVI